MKPLPRRHGEHDKCRTTFDKDGLDQIIFAKNHRMDGGMGSCRRLSNMDGTATILETKSLSR
ncbi:hypothetical protein [Oleiagrimonas soli]|nr:hypothetical protein [Oleiagrimonas soli]MBB6183263.1 hypothetical protein [Oleiagrimonas soli]